eukprot:4021907-Karenia_brevis.AAC.1
MLEWALQHAGVLMRPCCRFLACGHLMLKHLLAYKCKCVQQDRHSSLASMACAAERAHAAGDIATSYRLAKSLGAKPPRAFRGVKDENGD